MLSLQEDLQAVDKLQNRALRFVCKGGGAEKAGHGAGRRGSDMHGSQASLGSASEPPQHTMSRTQADAASHRYADACAQRSLQDAAQAMMGAVMSANSAERPCTPVEPATAPSAAPPGAPECAAVGSPQATAPASPAVALPTLRRHEDFGSLRSRSRRPSAESKGTIDLLVATYDQRQAHSHASNRLHTCPKELVASAWSGATHVDVDDEAGRCEAGPHTNVHGVTTFWLQQLMLLAPSKTVARLCQHMEQDGHQLHRALTRAGVTVVKDGYSWVVDLTRSPRKMRALKADYLDLQAQHVQLQSALAKAGVQAHQRPDGAWDVQADACAPAPRHQPPEGAELARCTFSHCAQAADALDAALAAMDGSRDDALFVGPGLIEGGQAARAPSPLQLASAVPHHEGSVLLTGSLSQLLEAARQMRRAAAELTGVEAAASRTEAALAADPPVGPSRTAALPHTVHLCAELAAQASVAATLADRLTGAAADAEAVAADVEGQATAGAPHALAAPTDHRGLVLAEEHAYALAEVDTLKHLVVEAQVKAEAGRRAQAVAVKEAQQAALGMKMQLQVEAEARRLEVARLREELDRCHRDKDAAAGSAAQAQANEAAALESVHGLVERLHGEVQLRRQLECDLAGAQGAAAAAELDKERLIAELRAEITALGLVQSGAGEAPSPCGTAASGEGAVKGLLLRVPDSGAGTAC